MSFNIEVESGKTVKLPTGGKYCSDDILVTATGGGTTDNHYDVFWDTFQENGKRKSYSYAFYGTTWNETTLDPKYNITPTNAQGMFQSNGVDNIKQHFENIGITLDFSKSTLFTDAFTKCKSTVLPVIDTTNSSTLTNICYYAPNLTKIEKLILKADGSQTSKGAFSGVSTLVDIEIEGKIGADFSIQSSANLSLESAKSIINALVDLFALGKSATLSLNNATWELLNTNEPIPVSGYDTWQDYLANELGWST